MRALLFVPVLLLAAMPPGAALRDVQSCFGSAPSQATCTLSGQTDVDWVFGVFFEPRPAYGFVSITVDGSNGGHERWLCWPDGPNTVACSEIEQGAKALGTVTVRLVAGLEDVPGYTPLPAMVPTLVGPWQLYLYLY
ncbi:MAG: hypothetical protein LC624_08225 [Halobacteriales archaeon]|nr:hypothetical protein [Halobacteriales archaeon]